MHRPAALTDLYPPYEFDTHEAPGCGQSHHDADCLCDVKLGVASNELAPEFGGWGKIATKVCGWGDPIGWLSEYLGAFEAAQGRRANEIEGVRQRYIDKLHEPRQKWAWTDEVKALLRLGLTLEATAAYLDTSLVSVVRMLTSKHDDDPEVWVRAEELLRAGCETYVDVARAVDMPTDWVESLANTLGVVSKRTRRQRAGGGAKYSAKQRQAVLELRDSGTSWPEIERATGVNRHAAFKIVKRAPIAA